MGEIASRIDQSRDLFLAENNRQPPRRFRIREIFPQIGPLQCSGKEELHRGHTLFDGIGRQLLITQQVKLKLPNVFRPELIGRLVEVLGKIPQCASVGFYGTRSVIATLELLQHHSSEMGHRDLLVTPKYRYRKPIAAPSPREASAALAA